MPTELEELVGFIGHPNPQIRLAAVENLVPFSTSDPALFKTDSLKPVRNLKLLVRDHPKIATHAAHMLVNLSADADVRADLVADDAFLDLVLARVVRPDEPAAGFLAMLLANMAKSDRLHAVLLAKKQPPPEGLAADDHLVVDQLLDLFVKGADRRYNKDADFDHLAYLFADLTQHAAVRRHLVTPPAQAAAADTTESRPIPLAKIKVFTSHASDVRRRGVASAIKNAAFDVDAHQSFLTSASDAPGGDAAVADILPYILLPLMGPESYDEDDMLDMLPEVQLLPPDKERERHADIVRTHLETLLLLGTTREGRERMREIKVYPIVRELHLKATDEGVQDACERLVQILMRDEADGEGDEADGKEGGGESRVVEVEEKDEENMLIEV